MYRLELEKRGNKVSLLKESVVQIFDPSILVLSLACYPSFDLTLEGFPSVIAVSASDGQIVLFDYHAVHIRRSSTNSGEIASSLLGSVDGGLGIVLHCRGQVRSLIFRR